MRPGARKRNTVVLYLGRLAGDGNVTSAGRAIARASYDLDGFGTPHGGVISSGELSLAASDL